MLLLGNSFAKIPVLSLRNGGVIARITGHLINPHSLKIDGLWCKTAAQKHIHLLLPQDIREITPKGAIVNDLSSLSEPGEVVRLKKIIDLHFELLDKKVLSGRFSIGKVLDYSVNRDTFMIEKLYVTPPVWGRFKSDRLTIDRSQVVEVSHHHIRVSEARITEKKQHEALRPSLDYSPAPAMTANTSEYA
jgi:hypothetical protein